MTSLENVLLGALALCCLIFSVFYAFIDYHHIEDIKKAILINFRDYFLGLLVCGLIVLALSTL